MTDDLLYLRHILDSIEKITTYASVGRAQFFENTHWQDAVIRQLEIIGEATKRLSNEFRAQNPRIPWRRIAGLRDVLIHDYLGVDLEAVWEITQEKIPELKRNIHAILNNQGKP